MKLLKRLTSLSLAAHVILALVTGIAAGVFFGDRVAFLETVGLIFIKLLQMTVIPYIATSLILGIGSMSGEQARSVAGNGSFTVPRRPVRRRLQGLPRFVVTRGGEYCFMPGLRALRWLTDLQT